MACIHNIKIMKKLLIFLILSITSCVIGSAEAVGQEEYNELSVSATQDAEYVVVTVKGNGTVTFYEPESKVVTCTGSSVSVNLKIGSAKVPGVGPIVRFSTSKDATVLTSDKQTYNVEAREMMYILIANTNYPAMSVTLY